ncbi:hypothetical protein JCM17961_31900 [Endothiovibrio diazotrophicus]
MRVGRELHRAAVVAAKRRGIKLNELVRRALEHEIGLDAADRGEEVVVSYRGKPRARLAPIEARGPAEDEADALFGLWRDHPESADADQYVRTLRKGRF